MKVLTSDLDKVAKKTFTIDHFQSLYLISKSYKEYEFVLF